MTDLTRKVTRRLECEHTYRSKRRRVIVTLQPQTAEEIHRFYHHRLGSEIWPNNLQSAETWYRWAGDDWEQAPHIASGDEFVIFRLQGCRFTVGLALRQVFLEAVRLDGRKVPRVLKSKKKIPRARPYKHTQRTYAKRYGVPKKLVGQWWRERAPLDNPDAMGDRLHAATT